MSIAVMSTLWEHSTRKGSELLVLLAMADFATDDGRCYPSVERLAKKTRLSERNVRYILRSLEECGEIETISQGGRNGANLYRILPPGKLCPLQPSVEGGATQRIEGGQPIAPEPSIEPPEKRQKKTRMEPMPDEKVARLVSEFPDFDVGMELDNARNIRDWETRYVDEYRAMRNRLLMKRADRAARRNSNAPHRNGHQPGTQPQLGRPIVAGTDSGRAPDAVV